MAEQTGGYPCVNSKYSPIVEAVEAAGFFATVETLDSGRDRIVCCGKRRKGGGYTGNSFWFAERDGKWFLGTWGGLLYLVPRVEIAAAVATYLLCNNPSNAESELPSVVQSRFRLTEINGEAFDVF